MGNMVFRFTSHGTQTTDEELGVTIKLKATKSLREIIIRIDQNKTGDVRI